ncbi:MAG TPA: hypothetical protein VGG97_19510 [Bryobacteraceae bacterium]|jgi:hypothetical protein
MGDFFSDLATFISSVFWRWQSWAGGTGFGGAILVIIAVWERWTGKVMDRKLYLSIILGIFIFGAVFMAWRAAHAETVALQARLAKPEFNLRIDGYWRGVDRHGRLIVLVNAMVSNPYGPQSSALDWVGRITANSKTETAEVPLPSDKDIILSFPEQKMKMAASLSGRLVGKLEPIQPGGVLAGWIFLVFKQTTEADVISHGALLQLEVKDSVSSTKHTAGIFLSSGPGKITLPGR